MMRSTLDVISYRKALCITTTSDWRREREKRGNLKCSVVFNASNKKKETLKLILFYEIAGYLAELTLQKENYEKCLSYFKYVLPLFHIVRKNPLKKLEHHVDSHDDIEIHSAENNRFTNG